MVILPVQTVSMTKMYPTILFNNILQFDDKPVRNGWTKFVCKKLYGERKANLHYIYLLRMFWYYKENLGCVLWRDKIIIIERRIIMCNFFFSHVFIIIWFLLFIYQLSFAGFPMLMLILFTLNQLEMSLGTWPHA